ncbi:Outer membrane protein (porin) [Aquisalimonas asiatica]|uniref:Outer membrane protein (Porin) n=1 Tax=Aquisalimonas asiatica TaxID=406100 RepID=A0A1H8UUG0_9GAMM|nr:Outer membrane protein (porin) [Aquisalimonas asiatica]
MYPHGFVSGNHDIGDNPLKQQIRKTLALGAGALCLAGGSVAHADTEVEIHGIIDVYGGAENPVGEDEWTGKLSSGGKDTSYWGISARHQVNDGLAVVGALEAFLRPDRGDAGRFDGDVFFARNANVGVETEYGTVRGGRVTAPLFLPMVFTNPFGGSFEFSPANYHTYAGGPNAPLVGDSGWSDTVQYTSPDLNGVTINVLYGFGNNEEDDSRGDDRIGAYAVYRDGAFTGTAAAHAVDYALDAAGVEDGGTQYAALLGGMYDFGTFQLYGQYQHIDNDLDVDDFAINSVTVGASVDAGPGQVLASYAYADASRFGENDYEDGGDRHTWAVGYELPLGDMATAYATYFMDDIDDASDSGHNVGTGVQLRF